MSRLEPLRYGATGAVLALGAPAGWLLVRLATGRLTGGVAAELLAHPDLYLYLLLSTAVVFTTAGLAIGRLVAEVRYGNARLAERAITDTLTGLRNRAFFDEQLGAECARGDRDDRPFALVCVDVDRFKDVNDRHGHATGDAALAHVAQVIVANKRGADVACRVGGEEFVLICPGAGADEGARIAERIRGALERTPAFHKGAEVHLTASFGVAARFPGMPVGDVLDAADRALYQAKAAGRNAVRMGASAPLLRAVRVQ